MRCIASFFYAVKELFLNVRLFKAIAFLLVNNLEEKTNQECGYAEACKHDERCCIVKFGRVGDARVGVVEYLADEQWEKPEADVLNPEDKGVCSADNLCVNKLRNAWPQGCRNE